MASRQDKATTDRNAKTLRELVKMPQNKFCADCKRNDARWASWNIGCFVCIRCSGIHRSMGTHISKVKSVDLDMWTPEQMASVQKWGNTRVNLYWEAHLKPGHMPPDHKMDSFIRSKYESRRWAMEGPPPSDPSVLEGPTDQAHTEAPVATPASPPQAAPRSSVSLPAPPVATNSTISHNPSASGSRTAHTLLSSTHTRNPSIPPPAPNPNAPKPATAAPTTANELFSLDFSASAPSQPSNPAAKKDVKQDILSLFSSAPPPVPSAQSSLFGAAAQLQPQMQSQSLMGSGGASMWGADSWSSGAAAVPPAMAGTNVWTTPQMQYNNPAAGMQNVWATAGGTAPPQLAGGGFDTFNTPTPVRPAPKQDDAFGDLWGSFK